MSESTPLLHRLICRSCQKIWLAKALSENLRCPGCNGAARAMSHADLARGSAETAQEEVRVRVILIMRITSLAMYSVPIGMYYFQDHLISDFFSNVVTPAATVSTVTTEFWSAKKSRGLMYLAVLANLTASVLFYFVATGFFVRLFSLDIATLLSTLPFAGSMLAITQLREYAKTARAR